MMRIIHIDGRMPMVAINREDVLNLLPQSAIDALLDGDCGDLFKPGFHSLKVIGSGIETTGNTKEEVDAIFDDVGFTTEAWENRVVP